MGGVDEESVPESRGLSERIVKWKVRWRGVPQALVAELRQASRVVEEEEEEGNDDRVTWQTGKVEKD